jgi:hypothetical protein
MNPLFKYLILASLLHKTEMLVFNKGMIKLTISKT